MPLREDLLTPIAGENPSGASLRYDRVYDQIKEARTEEDDTLPSGAWARAAKKADFRLVTKLAGEALATRSKDVQLAVWLGEALLKQEGVSALTPTLRLLLELQQTFWETVHPEIDEGDAGMRSAPLQWAATRYTKLLHEVGLTRRGVGMLEYKAARALGTEAEASSNDSKRQQREEAIAAGKLTSEDVDDAIAATPKSFYVTLEQSLTEALAALGELDLFCEERYGDDAPSFRMLRQALEEVENLAGSLLREKRKLEPDAAEPQSEPEETAEEEPVPVSSSRDLSDEAAPEPVVAAPVRPPRAGAFAATPESWEDALARIEGAVAYMSEQQPENALPFLLRSCMRTAELLQLSADSRLDSLPAPPTELRLALKRAAAEGEWSELHRTGLTALGTACGSGWLDLYRYLWTSCREMGWTAQQAAVAGAVRQHVQDVPSLPVATLNDDTPAANGETQRWIAEEILPPPPASTCDACAQNAAQVEEPAATLASVLAEERERARVNQDAEKEDLYGTARSLAAKGQVQNAIQLLARDASHQSVGRLRYGRNLQIAELCLESGNSAVAVPVLQSLVREVEERRLETWEAPDHAARPYALLLQCASAARLDTQSIFARLCAIDPGAALTMVPPVES